MRNNRFTGLLTSWHTHLPPDRPTCLPNLLRHRLPNCPLSCQSTYLTHACLHNSQPTHLVYRPTCLHVNISRKNDHVTETMLIPSSSLGQGTSAMWGSIADSGKASNPGLEACCPQRGQGFLNKRLGSAAWYCRLKKNM